jgi:hypothetical protein
MTKATNATCVISIASAAKEYSLLASIKPPNAPVVDLFAYAQPISYLTWISGHNNHHKLKGTYLTSAEVKRSTQTRHGHALRFYLGQLWKGCVNRMKRLWS